MAIVHSIYSWVDCSLLQAISARSLPISIHLGIIGALGGLSEKQHAVWVLVRETSTQEAIMVVVDGVQLRWVRIHQLLLIVVLVVVYPAWMSDLCLVWAGTWQQVAWTMLG